MSEERAAFEKWYKENYLKISGDSSWVERAWKTWQAAQQAAYEDAARAQCHWCKNGYELATPDLVFAANRGPFWHLDKNQTALWHVCEAAAIRARAEEVKG